LVKKLLLNQNTLAELWTSYNSAGYRTSDVKDVGLYKIVRNVGSNTSSPDPVYGFVDRVVVQPHSAAHKVIISKTGNPRALTSIKTVPPGVLLGGQIVAFPVGSAAEAESLKSFLFSNVAQFIIKTHKGSNENSKNVFKLIPAVDFTRSWTDAELYAHFNLTQDEIDLIEATVK